MDIANLKDYEMTDSGGTGEPDGYENEHIIRTFPFGQYEIMVELSLKNEFIGIVGIKINKDFRSYKQRTLSQEFHDVSEYYQE
ncbi:MAG: hypothetical protein AB2L14_27420 [Candidatus Xenobiia bacterium LiM19]